MSKLPKSVANKTNSSRLFKRFLKNSSGSLTPMLGLAAIPFFLAAGMAIDMSRVTREQTAFYGAVDSAGLAIAADDRSALDMLSSESAKQAMRATLEEYAKDFVAKNYRDVSGGYADVDLDLTITGQSIKIDATLQFPMTVMRLAGVETMSLKASSTIQKAMKPIELALVLDTTGSMKNDMNGLKTAANSLLAKLYADGSSKNMRSEYIRASLVPFSAAVRLDTSAYDFNLSWIDTLGTNPLSKVNFTDATWDNYMAWSRVKNTSTAAHAWNGCVESRTLNNLGSNYITADIAPSTTDAHSKFPAFFNPDSPSFYIGSEASKYRNSSGSAVTGIWNNAYIPAYANYSTTADTSLLAPSGSRRTGYDDSVIGKTSTSFDARFRNAAKYDNKVIGAETFTLSGDGVTWSVTNGPWRGCTASKVVPMTYDRAKIEAGISSMKAYGGTNIAEGLAWGMRTLSPGEPFTKVEGSGTIAPSTIAPYNGPRWQKIMVLMSDGQNDPYLRYTDGSIATVTDTGTSYNSFGHVNTTTVGNLNRYGTNTLASADNNMDSYTNTMCTNLKANGVTIYSIGFRVDSTLLKNCATSIAGHYKYATSISELVAYFDHIGQDVLNKMIYVSK